MTRRFISIDDGHGTRTLYRQVDRGDATVVAVVAVRRDTPADPAHLAAPPALDPDVYDLLAAVADPGEQVVERVARALEVHQLEWISHELGWDCGCNERGDLPAMLSILDGLRHQTRAVLAALREVQS